MPTDYKVVERLLHQRLLVGDLTDRERVAVFRTLSTWCGDKDEEAVYANAAADLEKADARFRELSLHFTASPTPKAPEGNHA